MGKLYPRMFVEPDQTLGDWSEIEVYFKSLLDRTIDDVGRLETWLRDASELMSCLDEVRTDRYVKMTCQTDDPVREKAYLDFIENIEPKCKPMWHQLNIKYTQAAASEQLPKRRYEVLDRSIRNQVELFREENVPLQTEEAKLEQKYQKICGAMTVEFDGREQTLPQLAVYAERTDRSMRRSAWEAGTNRRLQDRDALEDVFDELFKLRNRIARNAGCSDYREYCFRAKERFDYTPEDCLAFHEAIEKNVVPVMLKMRERRKTTLEVESLRPWDLSVDEFGRDPLRPFDNGETLIEKCSAIFHRVDPDLGKQFDDMHQAGYLDLTSRKGKAPGGYQATYNESRHPFIFMNAVGVHRDVKTLLHEGGHAFHAFAAADDPLIHYRSSPIEFAEVASMGMEMLTLDQLDVFYDDAQLDRAQRNDLEGIVAFFPWMAAVDAFQHWMYTHPDHAREERRDHWVSLMKRFGSGVDYTGYEVALGYGWHRQLHIFEVPFYYVEYGIAQLGALQLWLNAKKDRIETIAAYRRALSLGGSRPLPELFDTAGTRFDFSNETLSPLMEAVAQELDTLAA